MIGIRRILQNANEALTEGKLNDLAKSAWATVAAVLWGLMRDRDNNFGQGFIGRAAYPDAPGGSASIDLQPGLVLAEQTAEGDDYKSDVKPILITQEQPVSFTENQDANPRIDSVFIRPTENRTDAETVYFRDPDDGSKYADEAEQTVAKEFDVEVVEGAPGGSPSAPSAPSSSWIRVADVTRPSGQVAVQPADVDDKRTMMETHLSTLNLTTRLTAKIDTVFRWAVSGADDYVLRQSNFSGGRPWLELFNEDFSNRGAFGVAHLLADVVNPVTSNGGIVQFLGHPDGADAGNRVGVEHADIHSGARMAVKDGGERDTIIESLLTPIAAAYVDVDGAGSSASFGDEEGFGSVTYNATGDYTLTLDRDHNLTNGQYAVIPIVSAVKAESNEMAAEIVDNGIGIAEIDVQSNDSGASAADGDFTIVVLYLGDTLP